MDNMREYSEVEGFVLLCGSDGQIDKVVYNNLDKKIKKGMYLTQLVDQESVEKIIDFIVKIKENTAVFGQELSVNYKNEIIPLAFSGIYTENENLMVIGSDKIDTIFKYYEELMKMNNQYANNVREIIREQLNNSKDDSIYNDLTRVNNDLVNVQRKLNKKNAELKEQKEKYYTTRWKDVSGKKQYEKLEFEILNNKESRGRPGFMY